MSLEDTRSNVLPYFVWPARVKAAAAEVLAALEGTTASVSACASTLDAATISSWNDFYATSKAFLVAEQDPSIWGLGSQLDQIDSTAASLYQWQKLLSGKCTLTVPVSDPTPTVSPSASLLVTALEWGVVAVVAVSGAYGLAKIVEMVPTSKPSPRRALRP